LFDLFIGGDLLAYPAITMVILPLLVGVWLLFRGLMAAWSCHRGQVARRSTLGMVFGPGD